MLDNAELFYSAVKIAVNSRNPFLTSFVCFVIIPIEAYHESGRRLRPPLRGCNTDFTLNPFRIGGEAMNYVTYTDLFAFGTFVVMVVTLVIQITKK